LGDEVSFFSTSAIGSVFKSSVGEAAFSPLASAGFAAVVSGFCITVFLSERSSLQKQKKPTQPNTSGVQLRRLTQ
jgi:hypothetical protein